MCKDTTQLFDFLGFMRKYKIVIPKIQRDYAQGRPSASAKREAFAQRLIDALAGNPLMLDFVYGTVDNDNKDILYPLDGQQRLTTLFLLACLCRQAQGSWTFSYESRRPAQFFMNELKDRDKMSTILSCAEQAQTTTISDFIKKSPWYFASWSEDVNIAGMLRMLDSLYRYLCDRKGLQPGFEKITFYVKTISGNSTDFDQIYLKMNARGKALSGWDNLKASLDSVIPDDVGEEALPDGVSQVQWDEMINKWSEMINLTWPDQLWTTSGGRVETIDGAMEKVVCYAFAATFRDGQHVDTNWEDERGNIIKRPAQVVELYHIINGEKIIQGRFDAYYREWVYIRKEEEDENKIKNANSKISNENKRFRCEFIDVLQTFFTCLTENNSFFNKQMSPWELGVQKPNLCAFASNNRSQIEDNLKRLLVYYALRKSKAETPEKAEDWRRVVWNLVYNTALPNIRVFRAVFIKLKSLCEECSKDILTSLLGEGGADQNGTNQNDEALLISFNIQLREEQEKAKKIKSADINSLPQGYSSWKEAIVSAENHAFFRGRISFLYHDEDGECDWSLFETKYTNSQLFFCEDGVTDSFQENGLLLKLLYVYIDDYKKLHPIDFCAKKWREEYLMSSSFRKAIHSLLMSTEESRLSDIKDKSNQIKDSDNVLWTILNSDVICLCNALYLTNYSMDGINFLGYTSYSSRWPNWARYIILDDDRKRLLKKLHISLAKEYASFSNCWDFEYQGSLFRWHNNTDETGTVHSKIFIAKSEYDRKAWGHDVGFEEENGVNLAPSVEIDVGDEGCLKEDKFANIFLEKIASLMNGL